MNKTKRRLQFTATAILMLSAGMAVAGDSQESADSKPVSVFDPSFPDVVFEQYVGQHIAPVVGDARFGIKRIDGYDDALDKFTEVSPIDIEIGFTLANMYLWRGQNLGSDTSFQPYVKASPDFEPFGDLWFTFWVDFTQNSRDKNEREQDYIVDYTFPFLDLMKYSGIVNDDTPSFVSGILDFDLTSGYAYYRFPADGTDTHEFFFKIAHNMILNPYIAIYHDFDQGGGTWIERGISHDFDFKLFTLSTFAILGYNHHQWAKTKSLTNLHFGGSIPIELGTHMIIEPFLSYSKRLGSTRDDFNERIVHDELYGGFNYSIGF
ncbi:MAG: hypothetical protein RBU23_11755 [Candidatus Auribacterota bacterium]|jgi:hypothetical protein|nr:hypothetical protein [Candidatus Auribacterota bacterium]